MNIVKIIIVFFLHIYLMFMKRLCILGYGRTGGCNFKCSGNSKEICGGAWKNSVYQLGISISISGFGLHRIQSINSVVL